MSLLETILAELREIKKFLGSLVNPITHIHIEEQILSVDQAGELLDMSKSQVYHRLKDEFVDTPYGLPHHRKGHKTIYLFKSELMAWIRSNKVV